VKVRELLRIRVGLALVALSTRLGEAGRAAFDLGWRLLPDSSKSTETDAPPQDPLTLEAEELLWREGTRAGETPDAEPPAVHERRVRRA
jgi:hypothetical protein